MSSSATSLSTSPRLSAGIALIVWLVLARADAAQQGTRFVSLGLGAARTCGMTTTGDTYCWGQTETPTFDLVPRQVAGGLRFSTISVGGYVACGIAAQGAAYCWGSNVGGQLGVDSASTFVARTPIAVSGGQSFVALAAGDQHTCGVTTAGAVYCWGRNANGNLGTGDSADHATPVPVHGGLTFKGITVGDTYTCGLTPAGLAYCWGDNMFATLGVPTTETCGAQRVGLPPPLCSRRPVPVQGGLTFTAIAAGGSHVCGLSGDGIAYCWGNNRQGQLGVADSSVVTSTKPLAVAGGLRFSSIGAGFFHTCALSQDGHAHCWGQNDLGEVGVAPLAPGRWPAAAVRAPVPVSGGLTFRSLAVGGRGACGITAAGETYCWGATYLGNGSPESSALPVRVAEPSVAVASEPPGGDRQLDSVSLAAIPLDSVLLIRALKARPEDLAQGFLAVTYSLVFAKAAGSGVEVHTFLDGRDQTINQSNADEFVTLYRQRLKTYEAAIRRRGFTSIAGSYHTTINAQCARLGLSKSETTISQHDFRVDLSNNSTSYSGIVVESAVVIEHPLDPDIHLAGRVATGVITLRQKESNCALTLTRS